MIKSGKANVIIDGQWGSTGKGLLAGYLYHHYPALTTGVCDFMPNAGHTVVLPNGNKWVSRHIPISAAFGRFALIGPHASIDIDVFKQELKELRKVASIVGEIAIHPLATLVTTDDKTTETKLMSRIASTQKGGHAAAARKLMRTEDVVLAGEFPDLWKSVDVLVADTQEIVQKTLAKGGTVLCETAQGFDLGLNHGTTYPFVTGRDCLVGRVLDNAGVPVRDCGSIIGCLRTYPIRVGNTGEGNSGPCYPDQRELTWQQVSDSTGHKVCETTTVTGRIRRVFTFSEMQLRRFLTYVRPDYVFLNFWNYNDAREPEYRKELLWHLRAEIARHGAELRLVGCGPTNDDVVDLQDDKITDRLY